MYLSHELELIHPGLTHTHKHIRTTPFWRKAIHKNAKVGTYVAFQRPLYFIVYSTSVLFAV